MDIDKLETQISLANQQTSALSTNDTVKKKLKDKRNEVLDDIKTYMEELGIFITSKTIPIEENITLSNDEIRKVEQYIKHIVNVVRNCEGSEEAILFEKEIKGELGTMIPNRHNNPTGRVTYDPHRAIMFYTTFSSYLEGMAKPQLKALLVDDLQVLSDEQFKRMF